MDIQLRLTAARIDALQTILSAVQGSPADPIIRELGMISVELQEREDTIPDGDRSRAFRDATAKGIAAAAKARAGAPAPHQHR